MKQFGTRRGEGRECESLELLEKLIRDFAYQVENNEEIQGSEAVDYLVDMYNQAKEIV